MKKVKFNGETYDERGVTIRTNGGKAAIDVYYSKGRPDEPNYTVITKTIENVNKGDRRLLLYKNHIDSNETQTPSDAEKDGVNIGSYNRSPLKFIFLFCFLLFIYFYWKSYIVL